LGGKIEPAGEITMAIHSTFFLCDPAQLPTRFPGWKLPLPEPVTRKSIDPFTREEITITTRAPEWDDFDPAEMRLDYQVVAIYGDYETYLEQRIPPFVQSQPHWCTNNLTGVELKPLVAVASGIEETELESALYAHPSLGAGIEQIPSDFVAHLKAADDSSLRAIAEKWATRMSTPEYTHSVSGNRLYNDWAVDDALSILMPIAALAGQQTGDQSMYLLWEA
jgi:hypothetical protein